MIGVEDAHLAVLQNIEFATVGVYHAAAALHDLDVQEAVDALVRDNHAG